MQLKRRIRKKKSARRCPTFFASGHARPFGRLFGHKLQCELLEDRCLLSGGPYPELPGLKLVDPVENQFLNQLVYLDVDGEQDVTYHGPVTVEGIDIPSFAAPTSLCGEESAILADVLQELDDTFAGTGIAFTLEKPSEGVEYSTIYVGGTDAPFREFGSFLGLAEKVDVHNLDYSDRAFVFSSMIGCTEEGVADYVARLADIVAHESGRLLGYQNTSPSEVFGILDEVAATYYLNYGTSNSSAITLYESGRHYFQVNGIAAYKNTEWYVNGSYTGSDENDWSGTLAIDPEYDYYFSSTSTVEIKALVYDRYWNYEEYHIWNVRIGQADLTKSSDNINTTTVLPSDTLVVDVTVKNSGDATSNSGYVNYYFERGSRSYTDPVGYDSYGVLEPSDTSPESFSYSVPSGASAGTWYFYYWIDATETTSESTENNNRYYWTITVLEPDTIGPYAPPNLDMTDSYDTGSSYNDEITRETNPQFQWNEPDDRGPLGNVSGVDDYSWQVQNSRGQVVKQGTTSSRSVRPGTLPEGNYTFWVQARDNEGNSGIWADLPFTIDRTNPGMPIGLTNQEDPTFDTKPNVTWTAPSGTGSGIWKYDVGFGHSTLGIGYFASGWPVVSTDTRLDDGEFPAPLAFDDWEWWVRAVDVAGNVGSYAPSNLGSGKPITVASAPNAFFDSSPPATLYPTKTYTVAVDYIDQSGANDIQYVYLRLAQGDNENTQRLTLMHSLDTGWKGQWGDEGQHVSFIDVSKSSITNGYRVTWTFRLDWEWVESSNVDFYAWATDFGGLEGLHTKETRNAIYEDDLVIFGSTESADPILVGDTYTVMGHVVFEGTTSNPVTR